MRGSSQCGCGFSDESQDLIRPAEARSDKLLKLLFFEAPELEQALVEVGLEG